MTTKPIFATIDRLIHKRPELGAVVVTAVLICGMFCAAIVRIVALLR